MYCTSLVVVEQQFDAVAYTIGECWRDVFYNLNELIEKQADINYDKKATKVDINQHKEVVLDLAWDLYATSTVHNLVKTAGHGTKNKMELQGIDMGTANQFKMVLRKNNVWSIHQLHVSAIYQSEMNEMIHQARRFGLFSLGAIPLRERGIRMLQEDLDYLNTTRGRGGRPARVAARQNIAEAQARGDAPASSNQ